MDMEAGGGGYDRMEAGGGAYEPVDLLTRRETSPMRAQSSSTTMRPHTWPAASPAAHTQDIWSGDGGALNPCPNPSLHPSQNASHALLNNGKLLVNNGNSLVSQGHICNIEVSRLFSRY
jgi:hypothetical protein